MRGKPSVAELTPQVFSAVALLWFSSSMTATGYNVSSYLSNYQLQPSIAATNKVPFRCHNGGRVVRGKADFSMFPTDSDGQPFSFLQEVSRQGFHCACPDGWTGLRCGRPYEFCTGATNSTTNTTSAPRHVCFNYGRCIEGLDAVYSKDHQFCDCSSATVRGKSFQGKCCQLPADDNIQTCDRDGSTFCVHGECQSSLAQEGAMNSNGNASNPMSNCLCEEGYAGEHCDFLEAEQPPCDLDCGPGTCRLTFAHYDDTDDYHQFWQHNINHTFCSCPPGYSGTTCEISAEVLASGSSSIDTCDESLDVFCVNGGVCKLDYLENPERPCSCQIGYDGPRCEFNEGEVPDCTLECRNGGVCMLGIQSIHEATNYSQVWQDSVNPMYCKCPAGHHGRLCEVDVTSRHSDFCGDPSYELFCLHGACEIDSSTNKPTCHCQRGFVGDSCQYKQEEVPPCRLDCQHGQCMLGIKSLEGDNDVNRFWDNHVNFTYCRCDAGWYGETCEIPSIQCGNKTCLGNGTKCVTTAESGQFCDCGTKQRSNDPLALAGENCQYEATSRCGTATETYFCFNGGVCTSTSAGCQCLEGFSGPVCEYEEGNQLECSLECENGGVCKKGNKYLTTVTEKPELGFLTVFSNDNFEHCVCPPGFIGNNCQTKIEVCGNDNHVCLHGSKCMKEEDESFRCDCESAFTPESRYAGAFCQHHHTDICEPNGQLLFSGSGVDTTFCVNDGKCRPPEGPGYPGCDCIDALYYGTHCEFARVFTDSKVPIDEAKRSSYGRIGVWVYLFFLAITFTIFGLVAWRIRQKSREIAVSTGGGKRKNKSCFEVVGGEACQRGEENCALQSKQTGAGLDSVEIL